ncbi:MAG TPA: hypothetical protein VFV95_10740 [Vicinamibacterales bacterium]|nr:hypothetical protein [Vicinamibacterales bacterium]
MRRPFGSLLAAALVTLLCVQHAQAQQAAAPQKLTFSGDMVLWAFTVPPDKTADYEQVLAKLKAALQKLDTPEAKQQLAGWKVIKNSAAQPDGSILYIHVISPVVKDADYTISQIVYTAFPDPKERNAFYELYKGSVKANLFTIQAPIVADFSK